MAWKVWENEQEIVGWLASMNLLGGAFSQLGMGPTDIPLNESLGLLIHL